MAGFRRVAGNESVHPLVARMGPLNIINEAPVALLVVDASGEIVYRNQAGWAIANGLASDHSREMLEAARRAVKQLVTRPHTYPHSETVTITAGRDRVEMGVHVSKVAEGYVVSWTDVTAERDRVSLLAETADDLASATLSFEAANTQLSTNTSNVSERAEAVAAGAEQLSASIRNISASAAAAANNTRTASQAASAATERIDSLADSSAQIGTVSKLIDSIAAQTNLLALNATIEAARAGEAGKGFAVVAGEVKDLAGRTSEATGQIAKMIQAIQSDSADVGSIITQIVSVIGQIEAEQTTIAGAVEEQSATASEMSSAVTAVAVAADSSTRAVEELRAIAGNISGKCESLRGLL